MIDITVKIPEDRVGEFYELVGRWLAGAPLTATDAPDEAHSPAVAWTNNQEDLVLAKVVWEKFSPRAKAMFSMLMDAPGQKFSAVQLAEALDIPNGMYGVAGVLAWPGRHCLAVGRTIPTQYEEGSKGEGSSYRIEPEVAELFNQVR